MSEKYNPPSNEPLSSGAGWQPPTPDELHAQLPQYEILEVLGIGGMGAVYKGFQTSLERYVAIKILPPSFDEDEQYAQRFKQEAKTMARLSHVGIIGVHDCGQTSSGLLFIVMEFVEGTDIHRMIQRQGRLSAEEAMAITLHVCDALIYAHDNGVVHRDIKPANIMVDTQGHVKVADFGLAKNALLGTDESSSKIAMGTPGYVAPEALMMGVEVDQRVDVFGVGVMLYEMLTGKTPTAQFEPASLQVPGLDRRYDQVISRATRHDRGARYRSAQELKEDLIKIHTVPMSQSGLLRASRAASIPSRTRQPAAPAEPEGGFPVTLVGVGLAAVLAIGLFLWKPWAGRQSREEAAPSVSPSPESTTAATPAMPPQGKPAPTSPPPIASVPKAETLSPTIPPAAPVPTKPAPAPPPPSELDARLAKLDQQFRAAASRDVEPGFKASVATLDKGYVGALDRALAAASQAGNLEEALAVRAEKQRLEKGQGVPPEAEDSGIPANLKDLRKTYRGAYAKLEADRLKSLQPLYDKYDQALANDESELTKAGKIDDARQVRSLRGRIAQSRLTGVASVPGSVGSVVVFDAAVTIPANRPNGHAIGPVKKGDSISLAYLKGQWKDHGHLATENPDRPSKEGIDKSQLVIAHAGENGQPGDVVQLVPAGTAGKPFVYVVPADDDKLVLRINEHSNDPKNPGQVSYQLKITRSGAVPSTGEASKAEPVGSVFTNSLGMKFVAIPIIGGPSQGQRVLFSVWDTRVQDYEVFVKETKHEWRKVEFPQGPTHPAVMVDWDDAHLFCQWLTERERKAGIISAQQCYRLPTDHEWSCAVGIGEREDAAKHPNEKSGGINNVFPWGTQWPPSVPAGNYAGEELLPALAAGKHSNLKEVIPGYNDGSVETSPVGSFPANQFGLFDMGGNVWQWCEDWMEKEQRNKTLRGASWDNPDRLRLLLSFRRYHPAKVCAPNYGFRCVLAP